MGKITDFFDRKGRLTQNGRVLYAHAMHLDRTEDLPADLNNYVWEHPAVMDEIAELYELLDPKMVKSQPHAFFLDHFSDNEPMYIDWDNLDHVLENIIREALAKKSRPSRAIERKMSLSFKSFFTAVKVTAPAKDAVCIDTIRFAFHKPTEESCWLSIHTDRGVSKAQFEIPKGRQTYEVSVSDTIEFPSGLYYWTLLVGGTPTTSRLYICTKDDAQRLTGN